MSKDQAKAFLDKIHTDATFRQQAHDAAEAIAKFAKDHKFDCSREEISAALKEHWLKGGGNDAPGVECLAKFSEAPGF